MLCDLALNKLHIVLVATVPQGQIGKIEMGFAYKNEQDVQIKGAN